MKKLFLLLSSMCLISSANADSSMHWSKQNEYIKLNALSIITLHVPEKMHGKETFLICQADSEFVSERGRDYIALRVNGKINILTSNRNEIVFPHEHQETEVGEVEIKIENLDNSRIVYFHNCISSYYKMI